VKRPAVHWALLVLLVAPSMSSQADTGPVLPAATLGTDLMGVVTSTQWSAKGGSTLAYDTVQQGLPFTTDASGNTNHDSMTMLVQTPAVNLTAGKLYQFVLRMKADVFPQGQTINFKPEAVGAAGVAYESSGTSTWNVSRAGAWEEVYLTARPQYSRKWYVQVWVNLTTVFASTPSTIYVAPDLDVYELPDGEEVVPLHGVNVATDKDAFSSSTQRVDGLGNVYINLNGNWKHVFPRMIYRQGTADYAAECQRYKSYGFTGIMDLWNSVNAQAAIDAGLEHLSMIANSDANSFASMWAHMDDIYQWAERTGHQGNVLWYNIDNENGMVGDYAYQESLRQSVDTNHVDAQTGKRRHPVYFLNGNVGIPRAYHNASRTVMDITGSYVGSDSSSVGPDLNPGPTMSTEFMGQNQRAPAPVIQLQIGIGNTFIPSLFYGIIQGGRAMSVWRDGGSQPVLESTPWATAFRDDVSPKIDQMLPLIEQPHFTTWTALTNQYPDVRIGTRELDGAGYLILANFAATDLPVTVNLQGLDASSAVDMFTGAHVADVTGGTFQFTLGHYNNGYRVIHLITPVGIQSAQAESVTASSASIHFVLNRKAQARVEYGPTTSYGSWTTKESSFKYADQRQPISELSRGTTYHYRVHAWDESGKETISVDQIFTTDVFLDIDGNWAEAYIGAIYTAGITTGCGGGNYCPSQNVTRDQMAAFTIRAKEGEPASSCASVPFSDVPISNGFCKYIKRMLDLNITTGCGGGNYCPSQNVSRDQMAAFIIRAVEGEPLINYCGSTAPFNDVTATSGFCRYIKRLSELGVTTGCGNDNYCPGQTVTRDQMAAFLARAFLGM